MLIVRFMSKSAGQASWSPAVSGQASVGSVPINISSADEVPSQSESPVGTDHGGQFCNGLYQFGQLSVLSGIPSPSASEGEGVAVAPPTVGDGVAVAVGLAVAVGVGDAVAVGVGVGLAVGVGVGLAVGVGVGLAVGVGVGLAVGVGWGVGEGVGVDKELKNAVTDLIDVMVTVVGLSELLFVPDQVLHVKSIVGAASTSTSEPGE